MSEEKAYIHMTNQKEAQTAGSLTETVNENPERSTTTLNLQTIQIQIKYHNRYLPSTHPVSLHVLSQCLNQASI